LFSDAIFKQIFGFEFSRAPALRTSPTKDSSVRADQYSTCKICQTVCFQQPCYALSQRMWGPSILVRMAVSTLPYRNLVVTIYGIISTGCSVVANLCNCHTIPHYSLASSRNYHSTDERTRHFKNGAGNKLYKWFS
jgi:hypothetical protein